MVDIFIKDLSVFLVPFIFLLDLIVAVIFLIFSIKEKIKERTKLCENDMFIASMGIISIIFLYSISKVM